MYDDAIKVANETPDGNFIEELVPLAESIVKKFRQAYRDWKETSIKEHLDRNTNLNENYMHFPKYEMGIQYIRKDESNKLKKILEASYSAKYVPLLRTLHWLL